MPNAQRYGFEVLSRSPPSKEEVRGLLQKKQRRTHFAYLRAHQLSRNRNTKINQAERDLGLIALAIDELEGESLPPIDLNEAPPWWPRVCQGLTEFIEEDPKKRRFLSEGIYFQFDNPMARHLKRTVEGSMDPSHYEGFMLAAGVAVGLIVSKQYVITKDSQEVS